MPFASEPLIRKSCCLLSVLLLSLVLLGCDEEVAAVDPTGYPFEVYGLFDPTADTQKVRVFPIEDLLRQSPGESIDARVVTTDLRTGEERVWNDSLMAYPDGSYGYLFWAPFRIEGGRSYRVDVVRSDGVKSSATVAVPSLPHIQPYSYQAPVTLRAYFAGDDLNVREFEIEYRVRHGWCPYEVQKFTYEYGEAVLRRGGQYQAELEFGGEFADMRRAISREGGFNPAYGMLLERLEVRLEATNEAWSPPGGVFDPEVLVQPGTMSNVENGYGFIGSGYVLEEEVDLPDEVLKAAGYILKAPNSPKGLVCTRSDGGA